MYFIFFDFIIKLFAEILSHLFFSYIPLYYFYFQIFVFQLNFYISAEVKNTGEFLRD